jgi:hypothetical protein
VSAERYERDFYIPEDGILRVTAVVLESVDGSCERRIGVSGGFL